MDYGPKYYFDNLNLSIQNMDVFMFFVNNLGKVLLL